MAPSPRPSEARRVRLGPPPPPHPAQPARRRRRETSESPVAPFPPHPAPSRPGPSAAARENAAARQVPGPVAGFPSPAFGKNTYSRATQGGSGSGRCASRRRLQSSRSPRQRQGAGHRRSAATPRLVPAAGPARPNSAHSSSPSAAAGARSFGAPIAVPRPLARPCAPSPAPTSSRGWCPRPGPRVRALPSRSQVSSFLSLSTAKPFPAPEQLEGNRKEGRPAAEGPGEQRRRAGAPLTRRRNFPAASPPRSAQSRRGGVGGGASGGRRAPIGRPGPGHVTITGLQALGGSAGESGAEVVGNSGLHFPASRARSSTTSWEAYIKWRWRVEGSEQTKYIMLGQLAELEVLQGTSGELS